MAEDAKVADRHIRRDANSAIKADKTMDEDLQKDQLDEVQKLTDKYVKKIEETADKKAKEVMGK